MQKSKSKHSQKMDIDSILVLYEKTLIRKSYSKLTMGSHASNARTFLMFLKKNGIHSLNEVTKQTVNNYQNYLYYYQSFKKKPLCYSTQKRMLVNLKLFLKTIRELGLILFNPASDIELPRDEKRLPRNILKFKEIEKIDKSINENDPLEYRDKLIIELFYGTGIRFRELINIKLRDIDLENKVVHIKAGKGEKSRTIPLMPFLIDMIEKYLFCVRQKILKDKKSEYFFISRRCNKLYCIETLNGLIKRRIRRAKIKKKVTSHCFRHSIATELLKNGASIRHIQKLLGHKSLIATQIYTQVSIEDLKQVHSKCHPFSKDKKEV